MPRGEILGTKQNCLKQKHLPITWREWGIKQKLYNLYNRTLMERIGLYQSGLFEPDIAGVETAVRLEPCSARLRWLWTEHLIQPHQD